LTAPMSADVPSAEIAALAAETGAEQEGLENQMVETGEEGDDQPRRRRRRGGRNRNRRERENGELGELGENGEELEAGAAIAGEAAPIAEEQAAAQAAPDATVLAVSTVDVTFSHTTVEVVPAEASAQPEQEAPVADAVQAVQADQPVQAAPAETSEAVAETEASAIAPAAVDAEAATLTEAAPAQPEVPAAIEPAAHSAVETDAAPAMTEQQSPVAQQAGAVEANPVERFDSTPAVEAQPAAVAPVVAEEAAAPEAVQPQPVAAAAPARSNASMPLQELNGMLNAAGLTLASTDPEKLRAAQEAAARVQPAPRVPRERKPLPPASSEPLIQVETNR
jgi:ribonuclease E